MLGVDDVYYKSQRAWNDGYCGQKIICIDEFRDGTMAIQDLLQLGSNGYMQLEIKCGNEWAAVEEVVIISNYTPRQCYPFADEVTMEALLRRIQTVFKFVKDPNYVEPPTKKKSRLTLHYENTKKGKVEPV